MPVITGRVLIVEDEVNIRAGLRDTLVKEGHELLEADSGEQALEILASTTCDVAIGLIFGFLTPISLLVAIFLNLNYIALAGVRPKDITVNKAYQCEQGQNWTMLISEVVLFVLVSAAGCTWSIDHALGIFCGA